MGYAMFSGSIRVVLALTCLWASGCVGGERQLRQSTGPGPGPGCASTLDCTCKNGSAAACELLGKASRKPKPPNPGPVVPPGAQEGPVKEEPHEKDKGREDSCEEHYARCVAEGGGALSGHAAGYTRCGSCMAYCTAQGFWPEAIYTWNGVRLPCPGR